MQVFLLYHINLNKSTKHLKYIQILHPSFFLTSSKVFLPNKIICIQKYYIYYYYFSLVKYIVSFIFLKSHQKHPQVKLKCRNHLSMENSGSCQFCTSFPIFFKQNQILNLSSFCKSLLLKDTLSISYLDKDVVLYLYSRVFAVNIILSVLSSVFQNFSQVSVNLLM